MRHSRRSIALAALAAASSALPAWGCGGSSTTSSLPPSDAGTDATESDGADGSAPWIDTSGSTDGTMSSSGSTSSSSSSGGGSSGGSSSGGGSSSSGSSSVDGGEDATAGETGADAGQDATLPDASIGTESDAAAPTGWEPNEGGTGWLSNDGGPTAGLQTDGGAPSVECLSLTTNDLVLDPTRSVLYASVPSTSPQFGNSVVIVDPSTVTVTASVFVGSEPDALAVSDDGATLYVGIDGAASVGRVDLATGDTDVPTYLGVAEYEGARTAGEIAAVPGSATQYVVSRRVSGYSPSFAGLALYDGPTLLGQWDGFVGGESIAFASASVLYGYNNDDTGFDLYEFTVSSTGFQVDSDTTGVLSGFSTEITSQGGWIFATDGQAVNGANEQLVGQYAASGPVWPDADGTDVWFLSGASGYSTASLALLDFDRSTFLLKNTYALPDAIVADDEEATSLVRWSSSRFAFRTSSAVCIVQISP